MYSSLNIRKLGIGFTETYGMLSHALTRFINVLLITRGLNKTLLIHNEKKRIKEGAFVLECTPYLIISFLHQYKLISGKKKKEQMRAVVLGV